METAGAARAVSLFTEGPKLMASNPVLCTSSIRRRTARSVIVVTASLCCVPVMSHRRVDAMVYATSLIRTGHVLNVVPDVLPGGPQQGSAQHLFYFVA